MVEKLCCGVLFFFFLLASITLITFILIDWEHLKECMTNCEALIEIWHPEDNNCKFKNCNLKLLGLDVAIAIIYSVGATFLWRKPNQKSIRQLCCQLCCPPQNSPEVKYTLSLLVKLSNSEQIPACKICKSLQITFANNAEDADNADNQNETKTIVLTRKEDELIFVGSVELGRLDTGSEYTGRVVGDGPLAGETFKINHRGGEKRTVKLGRKWLNKGGCPLCFAHHWAVQVVDNDQAGDGRQRADFWYEVDQKSPMLPLPPIKITKTKNKNKRMFMPCCPCLEPNQINDSHEWHSCLPWVEPNVNMGVFDLRDAGCCGGEFVGKTKMTDEEIEVVYENWSKDKTYCLPTRNCLKFAYELIEILTDGNYWIPHSNVVANSISENSRIGGTCIKWGQGLGTAIRRKGTGDTRFTLGLFGLRCRFGPEFQAQFLSGRSGLGIFLNLSCNRVEFSIGWPWLGGDLHADINLNTGLGARNGNFEVHLLGFGGKVGTDGIELNTPWFGGYNIGAVPIALFYLYRFNLIQMKQSQ
eukprot:TRINITY_DN2722_c0_g1_i1.p1 TRINITY_DN2722_c0_g1~~TRINITY_DN2722_c0_g1_i1.p1  ORF type:complete len:609 (-),score=70.92 TRINITY_DN2722_c0_g1_i1:93-1679(-)